MVLLLDMLGHKGDILLGIGRIFCRGASVKFLHPDEPLAHRPHVASALVMLSQQDTDKLSPHGDNGREQQFLFLSVMALIDENLEKPYDPFQVALIYLFLRLHFGADLFQDCQH